MTATKKAIEQRRQRNRELAQLDARNRCGYCKKPLPKTGVHTSLGQLRSFCSVECLDAALEFVEASGR